jgi:hypothetical protein
MSKNIDKIFSSHIVIQLHQLVSIFAAKFSFLLGSACQSPKGIV